MFRAGAGAGVAAGVEGELAQEVPSWVMTRTSRSATRTSTRVPACWRPSPMWCSRLLWRRVMTPLRSTLSRRTRECWGPISPGRDGLALGRAVNATVGGRRPSARCGRRVLS